MSFIIAGGGLSGLSCAYELLNRGEEVTIIEARAEIGIPTRSPGYSTKKHDLIESRLDEICGMNWERGFSFRREWLEKHLAINLTEMGCSIHTRTRIVSGDENGVVFQGAGPIGNGKLEGKVIDMLGSKTQTAGWFGDCEALNPKTKQEIWHGGLCIKRNHPKPKLWFERADGLIECWWQDNINTPENGWLEIFSGEHQSPPDAYVSIELGIESAIQSL